VTISQIHKSTTGQVCKYALVGALSNGAGYLFYLLATSIGVMPKLAMTSLYFISAMLSFWGNRKLTFSYKGKVVGSGVRYLIVHTLGYLLNLIILIIFVDKLGYPHQLVQGVAILIVAGFLFISFKFFVFKPSIRS